MSSLRRLRDEPAVAMPRVTAVFDAKIKSGDWDGKVIIELGDDPDPEVITAIMRARADGPQTFVLVSGRTEQYVPGTEPDNERDMREAIATGLVLRRGLARVLAEQRHPQTLRIEPDEERSGTPVVPTGTFVGDDADAAVDALTETQPDVAARAAGRAAARRLRRGENATK